MQTVYACGGGGGSQQREVADGADVVFIDTGQNHQNKGAMKHRTVRTSPKYRSFPLLKGRIDVLQYENRSESGV